MSELVFQSYDKTKHTIDLRELHGRTMRIYVSREKARDQEGEHLLMALHDERTGERFIVINKVIPPCES